MPSQALGQRHQAFILVFTLTMPRLSQPHDMLPSLGRWRYLLEEAPGRGDEPLCHPAIFPDDGLKMPIISCALRWRNVRIFAGTAIRLLAHLSKRAYEAFDAYDERQVTTRDRAYLLALFSATLHLHSHFLVFI